MRIFSLHTYSEPILTHLLEFGWILSIFHGFSSERRKCAFYASHVFRRYLQAFARVWFTSGDFSRIFDNNTCMCIFRFTCILTIFAPDWFTSDHFSRIFDRNTCKCIFSLYMYFLAICLRAVPPVSYFSKSQRYFFYINGRYHQSNNFEALNVFRNLFHGLARVWFIFVHFSRFFDKKT